MIQYNTSLRSRPIEQTLEIARSLAPYYGISRVHDITQLDFLGIPVFTSIRPSALPGSLCVNAGKGLTPAEAEVGAYMEALEYAIVEDNTRWPLKLLTVSEFLQHHNITNLQELFPIAGKEYSLSDIIPCVPAFNILSSRCVFVPQELAFVPFAPSDLNHKQIFRYTTNGVASGNTLQEAILHSLLEIFERDIWSFNTIHDTSIRVDPETFPPTIHDLYLRAQSHHLVLSVRYFPNPHSLPMFSAQLVDCLEFNPFRIYGGYGCHTSRDIAITRAVTEAIQSRLSYIHGGRDDLLDADAAWANFTPEEKHSRSAKMQSIITQQDDTIPFTTTPTYTFLSIPETLSFLYTTIRRIPNATVFLLQFTPSNYPIQVVHCIIPTFECYCFPPITRVGNRLSEWSKTCTSL